jgi:predicted kinase
MKLEELKATVHEEPCLIMMIGPTGSGKSTLAEELATDEDQIVSSDSMRKRLTGDPSNMDITPVAFGMVHDIVEQRCRHDCVTFLDATNLKTNNRREYFDLARQYDDGFKVIGIMVEADTETCKGRQHDRERTVPEHVVDTHASRMKTAQDKVPEEGFDEVYCYNSVEEELEEL